MKSYNKSIHCNYGYGACKIYNKSKGDFQMKKWETFTKEELLEKVKNSYSPVLGDQVYTLRQEYLSIL